MPLVRYTWLPRRLNLVIAFVWAVSSAVAAHANPSVPWTPSLAARHALQMLADEVGLDLPVTQWPLPRAAVARALDALPSELSVPLESARARVQAELIGAQGGELSLSLRGRDEAVTGFGDEGTPGSWLGIRSESFEEGAFSAQLGARLDQGTVPGQIHTKARLDDSAVATEIFGSQLQAFAHRSWWGPGWQSSLLLGNNAPTLAGVGLQRAQGGRSQSPWLSWMGPWTYDFFVARNEDPLGSYFVGTRITLRPWPQLEIALSRTAQWGGRGHSQSLDSFAKMFVGLDLNGNTQQEVANDPANEMAGYDVRWHCGPGARCAVYAQFIGEDFTRHLPGRFLGLYGAETWSSDGSQRWFAEFAETICGAVTEHHPLRPCAYRNHAYPEGYTTAGRWIGSPFGSDARVLTLGWLNVDSGTSIRLHSGRIGSRIGVFDDELSQRHSGKLLGLNARQSWPWGRATLSGELDWFQINAPLGREREARAGITMRLPF